MRMPRLNTQARRLVVVWGLFLEARLMAHPETREIHEKWVAEQRSLRDAVLRQDEKKEDTVRAQAGYAHREIVLHRVVRRVASAVQVDLGGRGFEFDRIFRKGLTEFVALPSAAKVVEVAELEGRIAGSEGLSTAKGLLPELASARAAFEGAIAAVTGARAEFKRARAFLADRVSDWFAAYRAIHGELVARFPRDREFPESFFHGPARSAEPRGEKPEGPAEVAA
ncbi:MAG: hypothetical protein HY720_32455 [Planctomycetes bacterium]|nr:hypothetical protein [Planctomycetota bacterium]